MHRTSGRGDLGQAWLSPKLGRNVRLLVKALLLQQRYGLSDPGLEEVRKALPGEKVAPKGSDEGACPSYVDVGRGRGG